MKRKKKTAADTVIRLGALFNNLPEDITKAMVVMSDGMRTAEQLDCQDARAQMSNFYLTVWTLLLQESFARARESGRRKGPRLPKGYGFTNLLPHLSEARQTLQDKQVRFEDWCVAHDWPGHMAVLPNTARKWLSRYTRYIDEWDEQTSSMNSKEARDWYERAYRTLTEPQE